jgi:hypothetical protein
VEQKINPNTTYPESFFYDTLVNHIEYVKLELVGSRKCGRTNQIYPHVFATLGTMEFISPWQVMLTPCHDATFNMPAATINGAVKKVQDLSVNGNIAGPRNDETINQALTSETH